MQAVGGLGVAAGAPRLRWGGGHRRPGASRRCCCASAVASGVRSLRRDKMPGTGKVTFQEVFGVDLLANGTLTDQAILVLEGSVLVPLDIKRPMGMIVAERRVLNSMECFVEELLPESNALAAGVQPGDVLRMCTCVVEVRGKVDTFSFYSNPPKAAKRRAVLVCDKQARSRRQAGAPTRKSGYAC